ncbi:MAG: aminoacetone oxidase family FAD-binding enzyme [Planctomycetes bacterium]|nr:aminoacetone oxidase family FAD-binding enzyme [Planctomycetota bacterium]
MKKIVIIGAGAAGYFAAIHCAEAGADVCVLEASGKTLSKVRISGGGRCNVTHDCVEPRDLIQYYPRGSQELLGPFHHFGPSQLMQWYEDRGVPLKIEADGRVFPQSNDSHSIVSCLQTAADEAGVRIILQQKLQGIHIVDIDIDVEGSAGEDGEDDESGGNDENSESSDSRDSHESRFILKTKTANYEADAVIIASGSSIGIHSLMQDLGHTIIRPLPSLFTFKCDKKALHKLSGLSVQEVEIELQAGTEKIQSSGPLMITHWGFSGPAVLKASAWGARIMAAVDYQCLMRINYLPQGSMSELIDSAKQHRGGQRLLKEKIPQIPQRLWHYMLSSIGISSEQTWAQLSQQDAQNLQSAVHSAEYNINGKTTFKEEFVTAGGISRSDINWKRLESKHCPGIYFAGECIDVDALTGGFNFQNAWTTAWIAAQACTAD